MPEINAHNGQPTESNTYSNRQIEAITRLKKLNLIIPGKPDIWLFDDPDFTRDGHQERVLYLHAKGSLLHIDPRDLQSDLNRVDPEYELPKPWLCKDLNKWQDNFIKLLRGEDPKWD